jgi:endonuclease YncB( thermonuclease family)
MGESPMMMSYCTRFLLLLVATLLLASTSLADTLQGRVVGIADGDTVTVLDDSNTQFKIRLMGIDAPEKKQAFGNKSKESLSAMVFNKQVTVEYSKKDRYGRTVGKITVDGIDANLEQVKAGMAWHYKQYQNEQSVEDRSLYAEAEDQARAETRGLWFDVDPTPPWDWRRQMKNKD